MGWSPSMTTIRLFGGSMGVNKKINIRSQIYQLSTNTISINAFNIDDNVVRKHLAKIKSSKKVCIIGYPSAINNLADRFKSTNIKLSNVKLALTTSEQLIEDWKINIKNVFGCTVKSFYGCGEVESIGYQTNEKTDSYDIAREHIIVDSVNNNELLFTQLFNKAQPLIRYKNGDLGIVNNDSSASKISKLLGRSADYFFRSDGTRVSPVFGTHSILNAGIMVKKYQYVQHENNKIDFLFSMESGYNLEKNDKIMIEQIVSNYVMMEKTKLNFVETTDFKVSKSGKHRICVRISTPPNS